MRILHVITTLSVGGAETMLRNVVLGIAGDGVSQHVLSLSTREPIGSQIATGGVGVTALGARGGVLMPRHFAAARKVLREFQPDIVHTWMYHANVAGRWLVGSARRNRPVLITSVRGALNSPRKQKWALRLVRALDARFSADAECILFNSRVSAGQHAQAGYNPARSLVIPNGFDTRKFAPDAAARARLRQELGLGDALTAGMVARYEVVKGHEQLLAAAALLKASGRPLQIVLAGRGCDTTNAALVSRISELGLGDSVRLLGERSDVPALLNAFDFLVCPSLSESFPNAVGEAMSAGLPAVVTDVGDCAFLLSDSGFVARPADAQALADALESMRALSPSDRAQLGARARHRIQQDFSMESVVDRYRSLYLKLLDARASTSVYDQA